MQKKYMAVFVGSASAFEKSGWATLDPAARQTREQEGKAAWGKWVQDNAKSIVDIGSPLGKTKRTDMHGISDIRNALAAYTVVQAESHEAAAKLFQNHPHFMIFPGDAVEIMECLPIPQ